MANPWNSAAFPKVDHQLLDIMSEELGKRLQIEDDFVWVTKSGTVSSEPNIIPFTNIVQSELESKSFEVEETDITYDSDGISPTNVYEDLDDSYNWKCKNDIKRSVNMVKCTPKLPHMKLKEHKTHKTNKMSLETNPGRLFNSYKYQNNEEASLLPTIDFGESTNALLKGLIDQRYVGKYNYVAGTGKNSVVFHANHHRRTCITITCINAVKVYKLSNDEEGNKKVYKRAQREFEHMRIVHDKLSACPSPIRVWRNVILMTFACHCNYRAPSLNDVTPTEDMYWIIVSHIDVFYNTLHLVFGKVSAKNIRLLGDRLWFVGWGHSVKRDHPLALPKLIKDCHYITKVCLF